MTLLASEATGQVALRIGDETFQPVAQGTFGAFQSWEFQVFGRGMEWLRVEGEFPSDELLTLIVG